MPRLRLFYPRGAGRRPARPLSASGRYPFR